ncbi:MAG TPA: class D sortase [Thermoanaerobaculia bacterium]|nr:class D sortase [Thermoanaerobaculia bacterium]
MNEPRAAGTAETVTVTRSRKRWSPLGILEIVLWVGSLVALGSVGYSLLDAARYQRHGLAQLEAGVDEEPPPTSLSASGEAAVPVGSPLATLEISRLGIEAVVAEGDTDAVLRRAVGHLPGTAFPGEPGNVVLAAHRDTFFRGLGEIAEGDEIVIANGARRDRYLVEWTMVVPPDRVDVLLPTSNPSLTLITCHPFRWIGPAPDRFVVRARRAEPKAELTAGFGDGGASACGAGPSSVTGC